MKRHTLFLAILLLAYFTPSSFSQQFPWSAFFGGSGPEFATDIRQTTDQGYIVAGYGNQGFTSDYYVVKLNEAGMLQWERSISKDNYSENAYSVLETPDGNYIVVGIATNNRAPWLVKLNQSGDTLWTSQWTNILPMNSALIAHGTILPDSTIIVIGGEGFIGARPRMFIISQDGLLLEQRLLNPVVLPGWYSGTFVSAIEPTSDGGFMLTGTAGSGSSSKAFLWKFDMNADSVWTRLYNAPGQLMRGAQSVKELPDGGYVLAGFSSPNSEHSSVMRVDAAGNVLWSKNYPDYPFSTQAMDIIPWRNGEYLVTEKRFQGAGSLFFKSALLRLDSNGTLIGRDMIMASDSSINITKMHATGDGGFVMAGEINEYMIAGEQDLFVLKSDSAGVVNGIGIDYVWPGDINYDGTVNIDDLLVLGVTAGANGSARVNASLDWFPQYATDWADTVVTGINYKHADTDGDGMVNVNDTIAIIQNYGFNHKTISINSIAPATSVNVYDLYIVPSEAQLLDSVQVQIPVYLGSQEKPIDNLYGIRFSVSIDSPAVVSGSTVFDQQENWMGELNGSVWSLVMHQAYTGITEIGITRNNHQQISGFGKIGMLQFRLSEAVMPGDLRQVLISFGSLKAQHYSLEPIEIYTGTFQIALQSTSGLVGDANCDGMVNTMDVIVVISQILGNDPQPFCLNQADINASENIDLLDVTHMVNMILAQ